MSSTFKAASSGSAAGSAPSSSNSDADCRQRRLSQQLPSDLKPLLSMKGTLSVEHPSASADGGGGEQRTEGLDAAVV